MVFSVLCATAIHLPASRSYTRTTGELAVDGEVQVKDVRDTCIQPEGYRLDIETKGITVTSSDAAGAFYARQTLKQLGRTDGLEGKVVVQ